MSSAPLLIETILIKNGIVQNIKYHNDRCYTSRKTLFGAKNKIFLQNHIDTSKAKFDFTKCRITYALKIEKIEYEAYTIKSIESLKLVEIGDFSYDHKYKNREAINHFYKAREKYDDILMTRYGQVTDTYYTNVALLKNEKWYTPSRPILKGTQRAMLLNDMIIEESDNIHLTNLNDFEKIMLFNAMIPFGKLELGMSAVNK